LIHSRPLTQEEFQHIDNIIFDFGGVLFDIDYDAPVRAFAALGGKEFDAIYAQSAQSDLFGIQHVEGAHEAGLMAFHLDITKMDVREIFSKHS